MGDPTRKKQLKNDSIRTPLSHCRRHDASLRRAMLLDGLEPPREKRPDVSSLPCRCRPVVAVLLLRFEAAMKSDSGISEPEKWNWC